MASPRFETSRSRIYRIIPPLFLIIIIHPIHRFKLSDWLKEGHMRWIFLTMFMFGNYSMCVSFYYFPDSHRSCHSCEIWNLIAYFSRFYAQYGLKTSMNGVYNIQILTAYEGKGGILLFPR